MENEFSDSIAAAVIIVGLLALLAFTCIAYFYSQADVSELKTQVAVLNERNSNQQELLRLISKQMSPCECGREK